MLCAVVREDAGAFLSVFDTLSYLTLQPKELKGNTVKGLLFRITQQHTHNTT